MGIAKKIQDTMRRIKSENNAILEQGVGGISSINVDLHWISSRDFLQAFILMFAGIGVYLLFLFRSSWITLSTLISLIVAYYSSLSITERIFINGLGEDGLSWTVPFLSFVMLIALGVDYSIFLVMRFKEYHEMKPLPAIEKAVTFTGRAVISAMIILSGTCASLYPSGVNTLMQIATVVIIGLVLLTLLLPLLVPLVIKVREMLKRKSSN
jgi:RND superfamily putative drug exporter